MKKVITLSILSLAIVACATTSNPSVPSNGSGSYEPEQCGDGRILAQNEVCP
jgi:hypothetical protein